MPIENRCNKYLGIDLIIHIQRHLIKCVKFHKFWWNVILLCLNWTKNLFYYKMSRFYYKTRQLFFITKLGKILLQNTSVGLLQNEPFLLQNTAGITKWAVFITKRGRYYKMSRLLQNTAQQRHVTCFRIDGKRDFIFNYNIIDCFFVINSFTATEMHFLKKKFRIFRTTSRTCSRISTVAENQLILYKTPYSFQRWLKEVLGRLSFWDMAVWKLAIRWHARRVTRHG